MNHNYLVEVIQQQTFFINVDASSPPQAIRKAILGDGEITSPYPKQVKTITTKVVSTTNG